MLSRFSLEKVQLKLEEPFHSLARKLARIIPLFNCLIYCMPLCWVSFFAWSISPGLLYSCWPCLCQWIVLLLFVVILHCCFRNLCVEIQIPTYTKLHESHWSVSFWYCRGAILLSRDWWKQGIFNRSRIWINWRLWSLEDARSSLVSQFPDL